MVCWIHKILASWIRIRKNLRVQIQGVKYQPKTAKKTFLPLKPISEKFPEWFRIKKSEQKNKTKIWKLFVLKINLKEMAIFQVRIHDPDPDPDLHHN